MEYDALTIIRFEEIKKNSRKNWWYNQAIKRKF